MLSRKRVVASIFQYKRGNPIVFAFASAVDAVRSAGTGWFGSDGTIPRCTSPVDVTVVVITKPKCSASGSSSVSGRVLVLNPESAALDGCGYLVVELFLNANSSIRAVSATTGVTFLDLLVL